MEKNAKEIKFESAMRIIKTAIDKASECAAGSLDMTAQLIGRVTDEINGIEDAMVEMFGEDWCDKAIAEKFEKKYGVNVLSDEFGDFMLHTYVPNYYNEMNEDGSCTELLIDYIDKHEDEGMFATDDFYMFAIRWNKKHTDVDKDEIYYWLRMDYIGSDIDLINDFEGTPEYCHWVWEYVIENMETIVESDEFKDFMNDEID